jgi:hypothetical protein
VPKIKDRNPLYSALKAKAEQLRGAGSITGVIVGDGDCFAFSGRSAHWDEVVYQTDHHRIFAAIHIHRFRPAPERP